MDEEPDEVQTEEATLGFIAKQAPFRTNVFDYLAMAASAVIGLCNTIASLFDSVSDLLASHANYKREEQEWAETVYEIGSVADSIAAELGDGEA